MAKHKMFNAPYIAQPSDTTRSLNLRYGIHSGPCRHFLKARHPLVCRINPDYKVYAYIVKHNYVYLPHSFLDLAHSISHATTEFYF